MRIEIKPTLVETVQDFIRNIKNFGGGFFEWYVGITSDPKSSFHNIHKIELNERYWLLSDECPYEVALFIKKFLVSIGCVNAPKYEKEVDKDKMVFVYLFRMSKEDELYNIQ